MIDADRIRVLLSVSGRDQQALARAIGISPSTLSRALRGERTLSAATKERLIREITAGILTPPERAA